MIKSQWPYIPRAGDVVIYHRHSSPDACFLSAFQHVSQLTCLTYDDAIREATTFAARNRVDAWYTADDQTYESVARHRQERQPLHAAADLRASPSSPANRCRVTAGAEVIQASCGRQTTVCPVYRP
jgi:hypothetical protein